MASGVEPSQLSASLRDAYLQRLGLLNQLLRGGRAETPPPTLGWLFQLTAAHIDRVAYEDFDIHLGLPPSSLDPATSAARIAVDLRGGYCFQLNVAFASLLTTLGFHTYVYRGTVRNDNSSENDEGPPLESDAVSIMALNHAVVVVHGLADQPGQQFLVDVGLGDGPSQPIRLADGEQIPLHRASPHTCRLGKLSV